MKIMVTGADGNVATSLIPRLIKNGHKLLLIGKSKNLLDNLYQNSTINISYENLEHVVLKKYIKDFSPKIAINLAGYTTPNDEINDLENLFISNILFLGRLLDALKNSGIKLFINTGSSTEFDNDIAVYKPAYLYSATKYAGRAITNYYSRTYNFKTISVIPNNIYGGINSHNSFLELVIDSLNADKPIDLTPCEQILDFIHIDDIVDLFLHILEDYNKIPNNSLLPAGSGVGHKLRDIISILENLSGMRANVVVGGINYRKNDIMYSVADINLTAKICGWRPKINFKEGLRKLLLNRKLITDKMG